MEAMIASQLSDALVFLFLYKLFRYSYSNSDIVLNLIYITFPVTVIKVRMECYSYLKFELQHSRYRNTIQSMDTNLAGPVNWKEEKNVLLNPWTLSFFAKIVNKEINWYFNLGAEPSVKCWRVPCGHLQTWRLVRTGYLPVQTGSQISRVETSIRKSTGFPWSSEPG